MKPTAFAFLVAALASAPALPAHGDILSNTSPFTRSSGTSYDAGDDSSAESLEGETFAPFSPGDSDLGVQMILQPTPEHTPVEFTAGLDLHYTDNAPAVPGQEQDGSFLMSTYLGLSWQPPIAGGWFADVGLNVEFHEFEDSNALDFENTMPYIGVVKNFVDLDDTIFFARYEYQRITTGSASESDYFAHRIRTGLQKTLFVTPRQQLTGGINAAFDFHSGPDTLERNEYAAELGYTYHFTHKLSATAMARSAIWDFDEGGREDTVHTAGVKLNYALCSSANISTGVYYTSNDSDTVFAGSDSEAWQGGLTLGLNYTF